MLVSIMPFFWFMVLSPLFIFLIIRQPPIPSLFPYTTLFRSVGNTIIEPKFDGIDVMGDSPILRHNQVLRPHNLALHVVDYPLGGKNVTARPFLEGNNFRANALQTAEDLQMGDTQMSAAVQPAAHRQ